MDKTFGSMPTRELSGGAKIPVVGFGTFQIWPYEAQSAVEQALELGYRHIDTAEAYLNEEQVGAALAATGMAGKVFVTSKLRNASQGYDSAREALEGTLAALRLDQLDLFLIHWPCPALGRYVDAWRALVKAREEGLVRSIGVSNFLVEHLERLERETGVVPEVNQIESHPRFWQPELDAYCEQRGITVEAYSPLGHGKDIASEPVDAAARRLGVTAAQAVLRWHVQKGHVVLPKSTHAVRMRENLSLTGFTLTGAEVAAIDALDEPAGRVSGDPREFAASQTKEDMLARGVVKLEP